MLKLLLAVAVFTCVELRAQTPMVPSELGTARTTADTVPNNSLNYGATVTSVFDDNAQSQTMIGSESNFTSTFEPHASLMIQRPRLTSSLSYSPGFTYSSNLSTYNRTSQVAGADIRYSFSRRLSLHIAEAFTYSTNPFETLQATAVLPPTGILIHPNPSVLGANFRSTTNESQADLVYMLDAHSSIGVGGTFETLKYTGITDSNATGAPAQSSRGWSGHAFYSRLLSPRYSVGSQYTAQNFSSANGQGRFSSLSHQFLGFVTVSLNSAMSLSMFAGPELSQIDDSLVTGTASGSLSLNRTSFAGGSSFSWQGKQNGVNASFIQQVGDSGVIGGGAVTLRALTLQAHHQLTRTATIGLISNLAFNSQLDPLSLASLPNSESVGLNFSQRVSERLTLDLSAVRQQFSGATEPGFGMQSHDLISASLSYSWSRPVGR